MEWVPTADKINSTVPFAQILWPSSTLVGLQLYATCSRPSPLVYAWLSSYRVAVELIGYWSAQKCYPDHTRSPHDHFPINSTSTRPYPITIQLFLQKARSILTIPTACQMIAWSGLIELIWSPVGTYLNVRRSRPYCRFRAITLASSWTTRPTSSCTQPVGTRTDPAQFFSKL